MSSDERLRRNNVDGNPAGCRYRPGGRAEAQVEVAFADGQRASAQVVGADPQADLAVLRTSRSGLPAATFADGLPRVGELAIFIGTPLGFETR